MLAPVFASLTHGYDTTDHYRLDARLGDEADLRQLVEQAHARGIRLALDGVFNHVSREHPIVRRALDAGPDSPAGSWILWADGYPRVFEGSLGLVELNLHEPDVQTYVGDVMTYWLDLGVDGWRLDAAYAAGPDAWRPIVDHVKARHPECWITAEVIHGSYSEFVHRSGVDSVTQYELWKAIWSSLNDRNLHELAWALKRHNQMLATFRPQTFVGNHDVTRIATQIHDGRNLDLALALLLLLPGIPSIYAGDEQGFTVTKTDGRGGDDAVRPPFPADPQALSSVGQPVLNVHRQLVHLRRANPWLAGAEVLVSEVGTDRIALQLIGEGNTRMLLLNLGDTPATLAAGSGPVRLPPHSWQLL